MSIKGRAIVKCSEGSFSIVLALKLCRKKLDTFFFLKLSMLMWAKKSFYSCAWWWKIRIWRRISALKYCFIAEKRGRNFLKNLKVSSLHRRLDAFSHRLGEIFIDENFTMRSGRRKRFPPTAHFWSRKINYNYWTTPHYINWKAAKLEMCAFFLAIRDCLGFRVAYRPGMLDALFNVHIL